MRKKMMNNADYGLSLQKKICEKYNLDINNHRQKHSLMLIITASMILN